MDRTCSSGWIMVAGAICTTAVLRFTGTTDAADRSRHDTRLIPVAAEVEAETETVYAVVSSHPKPMLANVSDDYQVVRLWPQSDAITASIEALDQQCEATEFAETPFRDVVAAVADTAGVRISLDHKALEKPWLRHQHADQRRPWGASLSAPASGTCSQTLIWSTSSGTTTS